MGRIKQVGIIASLAIAGCAGARYPAGLPATQEPASNFVGYATMSADGVLHISRFDDEYPSGIRRRDVLPSSSNYAFHRQQADGIQPGETKRLRRLFAVVSMQQDRSLLVHFTPDPENSEDDGEGIDIAGHAPPQTIRPGDLEYDELIRRAGGLEPGQGRFLFAGQDPAIAN